MGNQNQPRDDHGRWSAGGSGSASGDHQAESPNANTRNVSGQNLSRATVVTKHAGAASVGTSRLSAAARDSVIRGKATDQRHFPIRSDANIAARTDQGKPQIGLTATPGRFRFPGK
ncbi:MAG TPA: hypothetical protein VMV59_06995 [Candidatus Dormibacteraeota bacterium]|nr:hypothetical protein [Candidatus Dormibacteraeota bacterium]